MSEFIRLKMIKENPFRKELGPYNESQIELIVESYKMSDFGKNQRFEARKTNEPYTYELVYGHHRLEALKRFYKNEDLGIEIIERNYNDEKMLVELLRENLIRDHDWFLRMRSLELAKRFLKEKHKKDASIKEIISFISIDKALIREEEAQDLLKMAERLDDKLLAKIKKMEGTSLKYENSDFLNLTQAKALSDFEDKKEQKDLANALKETVAQKSKDQVKLLSLYKKAKPEIKEKIRKKELDLAYLKNTSEVQSKDREEAHKLLDKEREALSSNQRALYIFNCLSDALSNIKKLDIKKLKHQSLVSLRRMYKKTVVVLMNELRVKGGTK